MDVLAVQDGTPVPFGHLQNGTPLISCSSLKFTPLPKSFIFVLSRIAGTHLLTQNLTELAETNFSGQAPGAAVSLIYMEIYPAYMQPPRKQH